MRIKKERAVEILMSFRTVEMYAKKDDSGLPYKKGITSNRMRLLSVGNEYDFLMKSKHDEWKAQEGNWSELMYNTDEGYRKEADRLMQQHFLNAQETKDWMASEIEYSPYEITLDEVLNGTANLPMDIILMFPEVFVEERS